MRKVYPAILVFFVIVFLTFGISHAQTSGPLKKLGRGAANMLTCPFEVLKGIEDVNEESGPFAAFTWGIIRGVFRTGVRAAVGAYEVVTFIMPIPKDYEPILTDPEFFWEEGIY